MPECRASHEHEGGPLQFLVQLLALALALALALMLLLTLMRALLLAPVLLSLVTALPLLPVPVAWRHWCRWRRHPGWRPR